MDLLSPCILVLRSGDVTSSSLVLGTLIRGNYGAGTAYRCISVHGALFCIGVRAPRVQRDNHIGSRHYDKRVKQAMAEKKLGASRAD